MSVPCHSAPRRRDFSTDHLSEGLLLALLWSFLSEDQLQPPRLQDCISKCTEHACCLEGLLLMSSIPANPGAGCSMVGTKLGEEGLGVVSLSSENAESDPASRPLEPEFLG